MRALGLSTSWALAGAITLVGAVSVPALAADYDPATVKTPPLRPIVKIEPLRTTLENGIVVYLLENHDLPVVRGTAYAKASPTWIPDAKLGLGSMTGDVMRSGGTKAHPGDWLDDHLAALGASVSTSYDGQELADADFRALSDNATEVIGLWAEVMRAPAFPEDKLELAKVGMRRAIAERNDEMFPVLARVARNAIYGKGNVWARYPEYATVEAVTPEDCHALHHKIFEPSHVVVAIYGDFRAQDMLRLLTAKLGDWKDANVPVPPAPPVPTDAKPRLVFAPKEDVTQSGVIVAHVGFRADDPDYPPMDVYQTALGGGFQSRLVNKIRSERGLAYATGAQAGEGFTRPGLFLAYSLTKSESTMTAHELLRQEVRRSVEEPFTEEEIRLARNTVENTFVFKFEQPSEILFRAAYYQVIGYPQDFLQRYQQALSAVTGSSVHEAARRKVHPDRLVTVIVGKEKDFDHPLESAGLDVERVDITIPGAPRSTDTGATGEARDEQGEPPSDGGSRNAGSASATGDALAEGRSWLAKASALAGGTSAWRAVRSLRLEESHTVTMHGQSMKLLSIVSWRLPDRILSVQKFPFGAEAHVGFDGRIGWSTMGTQHHEDPAIGSDVRAEYDRSLFHLFGHPDEVTIRSSGEAKTIDGVAYRVAAAKTNDGRDFTLYFAADGTLARIDYVGPGPEGTVAETEIFADWKPVGAIRYPHARQVMLKGEPYLDAHLASLTLNPQLEDALFKKPAQ